MTGPEDKNLPSLVNRLEFSYYDSISILCDSAIKQAHKLQELEVHQVTSQYVNLCFRLIEEVRLYIRNKKEHFIPYLNSLVEKVTTNHDCSNCNGTGSCALQHDIQLAELRESHLYLKEILNRLQMVALPLYSETIYPDAYRVLRNQMALIENKLAELFFFEETHLLQKVAEAQKNINVRN